MFYGEGGGWAGRNIDRLKLRTQVPPKGEQGFIIMQNNVYIFHIIYSSCPAVAFGAALAGVSTTESEFIECY